MLSSEHSLSTQDSALTTMSLRFNRTLLTTVVIALALSAFAATNMRPAQLASVLLSGLTLGALYFLVTSGLSLIFGLMDVLNFAHGVIFMLGAYVGFTLYSNPRTILNLLPLCLALGAGLSLAPLATPLLARADLTKFGIRLFSMMFIVAALSSLYLGFARFPLDKLIAQSATATGGAVATAAAQEADDVMLFRLIPLFTAGFFVRVLFKFKTQIKI